MTSPARQVAIRPTTSIKRADSREAGDGIPDRTTPSGGVPGAADLTGSDLGGCHLVRHRRDPVIRHRRHPVR